MKTIEIIDSKNFQDNSWAIEKETDNQIILSLLNDVDHFHAIRFPKKKIIWVTNLDKKEINYFIELSPLRHLEPNRQTCNETDFFFGGDDNSLYQFSNINIKTIIKEPFHFIEGKVKDIDNLNDLPCNELLFMEISHHSKLIFFNCVFHNTTDKNYKIETWHDAVVEFINCEFRGEFTFVSNHDSIIIKH